MRPLPDRRVRLAGLALLAAALGLAAPAFAAAGQLGPLLVAGGGAVGAAAATLLLPSARAPALARLGGWLGDAPLRNALGAGGLAAYFALRGRVGEGVGHLPVWEWALGVAVLALLLSRAKAALRRDLDEEPWVSEARRHSPVAAPRLDPAFAAWSRAVEGFVEHGTDRQAYEELWRRLFGTVARRPETVRKAMEPLEQHRDLPAPVVPLRWARTRVDDENRRRRQQVHRTLLARYRAARKVMHGTRGRQPHPRQRG